MQTLSAKKPLDTEIDYHIFLCWNMFLKNKGDFVLYFINKIINPTFKKHGMLGHLWLMAFIYVHFPLSYYFKIHRLLFINTNPQLELGECKNMN